MSGLGTLGWHSRASSHATCFPGLYGQHTFNLHGVKERGGCAVHFSSVQFLTETKSWLLFCFVNQYAGSCYEANSPDCVCSMVILPKCSFLMSTWCGTTTARTSAFEESLSLSMCVRWCEVEVYSLEAKSPTFAW